MRRISLKIVCFFIIFIAPNLVSQTNSDIQKQNHQLLLLAKNYERSAQYKRALEIYQQLWRENPTNINYYRGVKNNLLRLNRFDEAKETVIDMLERSSSVVIKADLGDVYYKMGREDSAYTTWNRIIEENPKRQIAYQVVANSLIGNLLYDKAIEIYKKGQSVLKNKKIFLIEMANLYRSQMDYKNAVNLYLDYLIAFQNQYQFVENNIISFANNKEIVGEVEQILLERIKKNRNNMQIRNILAAFYIRSSNYQAALEEYSTIDQYIVTRSKHEKSRLGRELYRFAQNAFNDGAYEYAIQAYQLILSRYPNSSYVPNSKLGIGKSYEELGNYSKAIEIYNQIIQSYSKSPLAKICYFRIGQIQLEKLGESFAAEKAFKKVLGTRPFTTQNYEAIFRIGDCYVHRGDIDQGLHWYNQILHQKSIDHFLKMKAYLKIGKIYFWKGDFEKARENFQKIESDQVDVLNEHEGIFVNDALEYQMLIEENREHFDHLKKYAQAELLIEQKKVADALNTLNEIAEVNSVKNLTEIALLKIGELQYQRRNYNEALTNFQKIVAHFSDSPYSDFAQKMIGDIYLEGYSDFSKAIEAYELVLSNYHDSIYLEEVRNKIRQIERK